MEEILINYINGLPNDQDNALNTLLARDEEFIFNTLRDVRGIYRRTLIHSAARKGDTDTLRRIRQRLSEEKWGTLLEEKDTRNGDAALHLATTNGHPDTVSYILHESMGEDVRKKLLMMKNNAGCTPVHCAVRRGDKLNLICPDDQTWCEVLQVRNNDGDTAVHVAARKRDFNKLRAMLTPLPEVSKCTLLKMKNKGGHSALDCAVDRRHSDIVAYIIENGGYTTEEAEEAQQQAASPLNGTCCKCQRTKRCAPPEDDPEDDPAVTSVRADDPAETKEDPTFLDILEDYGSPNDQDKAIDTLLEDDAQTIFKKLMKVRGVHEHTLIHSAARKGNTDTLRKIRQELSEENWGRLLEEKDTRNGDTALHLAATNGHPDTVSYILYESLPEDARKKLLQKQNSAGYTLVHCAVRREGEFNLICPNDQTRRVNTWLEVLKVRSNDGDTAVHVAARKGDSNKLRAMLAPLPDVSKCRLLKMQNDGGHSALRCAVDRRHPNIAAYIIENGGYEIEIEIAMDFPRQATSPLYDTCCQCQRRERCAPPEDDPKDDPAATAVTADDPAKAADDPAEAEVNSSFAEVLKNYLNGSPNDLDKAITKLPSSDEEANFNTLMSIRDDDGYTAIHFATLMGEDDILFKLGESFSAQRWYKLLEQQDTRNGNTALHIAARNYQRHTVDCLLHSSVKDSTDWSKLLKIKNNVGYTPVYCAVSVGVSDPIFESEFLGFQVMRCLRPMIQSGFRAIINIALDKEVNTWFEVFEIKSKSGNTVIHEAAHNGDKHKLEVMLAKVPDQSKHKLLQIENNGGHTAFDCAVDRRHPEIVEYMIKQDKYLEKSQSEALKLVKQRRKSDDCQCMKQKQKQ